jgi:hypothetical protein
VDDKESLLKAFKGAYAVFAVTNYWDKLDHELEYQQGNNLADAALVSYYPVSELQNSSLIAYIGIWCSTFYLEFASECY